MKYKKLVIFDLDQTLIDVVRFNSKAFELVFQKMFGIKSTFTKVNYPGKTIKDLVNEVAELEKMKRLTRKQVLDFIKLYELKLKHTLPKNLDNYLLPGVRKLLKKLSKNYLLAIITGSPKHEVNKILKNTKLKKYFKIVLTGEDARNKKKLARLAHKKADIIAKKHLKPIMIGDSTEDINAGRAINALTIGVTTGLHSRERLLNNKANYVFNSLENKSIYETING